MYFDTNCLHTELSQCKYLSDELNYHVVSNSNRKCGFKSNISNEMKERIGENNHKKILSANKLCVIDDNNNNNHS